MSNLDVEMGENPSESSGGSGLSRRTLLKAGAVVGGGIWAAPVVESFVSKAAAATASTTQVQCQQDAIQVMTAGKPKAVVCNGVSGTLYSLTVNQRGVSSENCYFVETPSTGATSTTVGTWSAGSGGIIISSVGQTSNCYNNQVDPVVASAQLFVPDGKSAVAEYSVSVTFAKTANSPSVICTNSIQGDPSSPPDGDFPRPIS